MTRDHVGAVVRTVVELLIRGKYEELERLTHGRRLAAKEMELVRFKLWTKESGRSDLSVELIVGGANGRPDLEITGIVVF